jgi:hypothetical protein
LTAPAKRLVATLEMIPLARFVPCGSGWIGRPSKDRLAIASAFVAKAVYGFCLTRQLLDALATDAQLRRICGWKSPWQVPHESTFSRAFAEFSLMELPQLVHEALIRESQKERLIRSHCTRLHDHEARERYPRNARPGGGKVAQKRRQRPGRAGRKKVRVERRRDTGGQAAHKPKPDTRLETAEGMTLPECWLICRALRLGR